MDYYSNVEDIDELINREKLFYKKALDRQNRFSEETKKAWRDETTFERRQRLSKEVYASFNGEVMLGPFKGTRYSDNNHRGMPDFGSMLLGFYELEVLDYLTSMGTLDLFVDIGAAEGYYPIGMANSHLAKKCIGFETNEESLKIFRQNLILNPKAVENVTILGHADSNMFSLFPESDPSKSVILCDIAGGEFELFSEETLFNIKKFKVIIEIHHWLPNFMFNYTRLLERATKFFNISFLKPKPRNVELITYLDDFTDDNRYLLCSEGRPQRMRYLVLEPKDN